MSTTFLAGNIANHSDVWEELTDDPSILTIVKNCTIDFDHPCLPSTNFYPKEIKFSTEEGIAVDLEISKFLDKGIINEVEPCEGQFLSKIFTRPKPNGSIRVILDLSRLNEYVSYQHFKMESFDTALDLIETDCFFASIDLRDAYYSVPIGKTYRKLLRFTWRDKLFEFSCMPMGLASAPRIFTKLMKPVFGNLRSLGFTSVAYIDDSLLIGKSYEECFDNIKATLELLQSLGFSINFEKSVLTPTKEIKFLGFILNSNQMMVSLPLDKVTKIKEIGSHLLKHQTCTIQMLASFIGLLVSSFNAVNYGPLHYRFLERDKSHALRCNRGNYDSLMKLSSEAIDDIQWWIDNIDSTFRKINREEPSVIMSTDASSEGWGAVLGEVSTGGRWLTWEKDLHINVFELKAILFGLKSLCSKLFDAHIRVKCDNTTAVAYVNNMGGMKSVPSNECAKEIWQWCIDRRNWISSEHLPGVDNVLADKESRVFHDNTEWMLDMDVFDQITEVLGCPDIDLFASRLNKKCPQFVSWKPDPDAYFVDAFTQSWRNLNFYAFPPFSLVNKMLGKIAVDQAEGLIVVPLWTSQPWFPRLLRLLIRDPIVLPLNILSLSYKEATHPLHKKLRLIACLVSGSRSKTEAYLMKLPNSSSLPGVNLRKRSIALILRDGFLTALSSKLIPIMHLRK